MGQKESFIIHTDIWPVVQKLNREQRGDLFSAILQHALGEDLCEMDALTDIAYSFMAAQMDRDAKKYQDICARRAEYGRRGGIAKANKSKQELASVADTDTDTDTVTDSDTDIQSLSYMPDGMSEELQSLYGDRTEALIEDVRRYYESHPEKEFPGWPIAVAQFNANQKRWGSASKAKKRKESQDNDWFIGLEEEQ